MKRLFRHGSAGLHGTSFIMVAGFLACLAGPPAALGSSPTGHILISEQVIKKILKDPNANPELKALLRDPKARAAFAGGACAPDLDSLADQAHTSSPKALADSIMANARANLAKAQKALDSATTPEQKARAQAVLNQAKCDVAFAYGWRTHGAADLETHPYVNASGENYWDDETRDRFTEQRDQALHGEWETMQESNWIDKYGNPMNPDVDYRLGLLEQATGHDHNDLLNDVQTLSKKDSAAKFVGDKYTQGQLDDWKRINDGLGDSSVDLGVKYVNDPNNPFDDSCWDVGLGVPVEGFRKFIEDLKAKNNGKLPDGFWVNYQDMYKKWLQSRSGTGTAGGDATGINTLLPPPAQAGTSTGSGRGSTSSGGRAATMDKY